MKKISIMIVVFFLFVPALTFGVGPDLQNLESDFSALLQGIGEETFPYLQQNALIGNGIGSSEMHEGVFFFGFTMGATISPGILTFLDDENGDFELLNVGGLLDTALAGAGPEINDVLAFFQEQFFYPQFRFSLGIHLPWDLEVIALFSIFPQGLTDFIVTQIGVQEISGLTFNRMNAGGRVRKVLLSDSGGFPAISVGIGYTYSQFNLGYQLPAFSQDFAADFKLNLESAININTRVHTAGIDLTLSKKLAIFFPFIQFATYYHWSKFDGSVDPFKAEFTDSTGSVIASTQQQNLTPQAILMREDLSLLLEAGIEIKLGKFYLVPYGSFNIPTKTFAAALTMRLQF